MQIPLSMLNRHGLVAGATGTGKTKTLQLMAEQISPAGVPVFAADIKGDLSGIASPGQASEKLLARTTKIGQDWQPQACPVEFFALGGQGIGVPLRATMSSFGPVLLSKVLGLERRPRSPRSGLVFHYADAAGLPLLDLADLRAVLQHLTSDEGKARAEEDRRAEQPDRRGDPALPDHLLRPGGRRLLRRARVRHRRSAAGDPDGHGVVSLLELPNLQDRPAVFSTFLMWLLADLFHDLPEVGDIDKPKLVFFFDEAHLLFNDASQGVPGRDRPDRTADPLQGRRHLLRHPDAEGRAGRRAGPARLAGPAPAAGAHPERRQGAQADRGHLPEVALRPGRGAEALGIGEAIVTVMDPDGAPTPVAWTRMRAPQSLMAPTPEEVLRPGIAASPMMAKYGQPIDRDSARERLARTLEEGAQAAEAERQAAEAERQAREAAKQEAAAARAAERSRPPASRSPPAEAGAGHRRGGPGFQRVPGVHPDRRSGDRPQHLRHRPPAPLTMSEPVTAAHRF